MRNDIHVSAETIQRSEVLAEGRSVPGTIAAAREVMAENRICLVRGFATEPGRYLEFLRGFGEPLANYASRSDLDKEDPHPQINRVKYKRKGEYAKQSVHYVAGGLRPHSARSWRAPRPAYFAMLMVDPGWRDTPEGERGESLVLCWQRFFARLAERDGDLFDEHFRRLRSTSITFQANNVRERNSDLPLCYELPDMTDRFDVGVRLKQDLQDKILDLKDEIAEFDKYQQSLEYLVSNAADETMQASFPMDSGDLLLLDNNRFAHGRHKIVGERVIGENVAVNPRELWSVTVH
ncbi:TauD/TfdA family dioxygenase [Amycolatopsis cihanbeyliensis]|uniref:TfdA family taurine catabolism dioxygenase TauD n=1 Tax=Amycolatopsis cihanbeyliensis TaxID=1128664 RepID=A0A542DDB6_AMYCI|nr:TauD/TfdA family dioxygenase [Amycolatopsis cihanbeyliensis]TQJ01070.1 TfdA family taurine catabolism dioxygenase TauD [Amycolatopsis cihanbeyliensis]